MVLTFEEMDLSGFHVEQQLLLGEWRRTGCHQKKRRASQGTQARKAAVRASSARCLNRVSDARGEICETIHVLT